MVYFRFHPETGNKKILKILLILSKIFAKNRIHSLIYADISQLPPER